MTYPVQPDAASYITRSSVRQYVLGLHCLRVAADEGWLTYAAGEYRGQLVKVSRGRTTWWRYLRREWVHPWAEGLADQHKAGHLIDAAASLELPELVTLAEAGAMLDVRYDRLRGLVADRVLYPVYAEHKRQYLFRAQVDLLARERLGRPTSRAGKAWVSIEAQLPPFVRPGDLTEPVRFRPSPNPLPMPFTGAASARQGRVCAIAHDRGWLTFRGSVLERGTPSVFTVEVAGPDGPRTRELVQSRVMAYMLGAADFHGESRLVAFAEDQG